MEYLVLIGLLLTLTAPTKSAPGKPKLIGLMNPKVNGDEECVRTSQYAKPKSGQPCKNLGQCYKYRCGAIARHCSSCGEENKGPCIDYSTEASTQRPQQAEEPSRTVNYTMDYLYDILNQEAEAPLPSFGLGESDPRLDPVRIETIGNAIVHLRAGDKDCAGFVASLRGGATQQFLVMTSAQCLTRFEVECQSERSEFGTRFHADTETGKMVDGFMTYQYNHSTPCFGDYDSDVTSVRKGFRSYIVTVTSYTGSVFNFPLNSDHVIVPRDYMECQDCRNDFAAIKITDEIAAAILRGSRPFQLSPSDDPMDLESENLPNFVTVKAGFPPTLLRRAADVEFCTVNHSTKQKMCFSIPLPLTESEGSPTLLLGSPVFLAKRDKAGELNYHCIGIFTGFFTTFEKSFSMNALKKTNRGDIADDYATPDVTNDAIADDVSSDGVSIKFSNNGAVRITGQIVSFLKTLCEANTTRLTPENMETFLPHSRRDCYPKLASPWATEDRFCLCALGWTSEESGCTRGFVTLTDGCNWDGKKFACEPRMRRSLKMNGREMASTIIKEIVVPGTARHLDLRGQQISDGAELTEMLRHLTSIQNLILDYNELTELASGMFDENRELRMILIKHNRIERLSATTFRYNKKLSHINLGDNQITRIPGPLLRNAPALQYLNVQNNNITVLHPTLLIRNLKLSKLYLGNNRVRQVSPKFLVKQKLLKEFWIARNSLRQISAHAFAASRQLMLVDLSYNRLNFVPKSIFDFNRELRFVNLNYNNLKSIPRRLFTKQRKLKSVSLSGNPLLSYKRTREQLKRQGIPME